MSQKSTVILLVTVFAVALSLGAAQVMAFDQTQFELDGNAMDAAGGGDDWSTLKDALGGANVKTVVPVPDPAPQSIFTTGGSKDTRDVSAWRYTDGSVPDKDNLTNAYAAAYENGSGELVIYFGADRFSNDGDAMMGFWFLQNTVKLGPGGVFVGSDGITPAEHKIGDILVLVNFTGGGLEASIEVLKWVGLKGNELEVVLPSTIATCNAASSQFVCSITNGDSSAAPWPYTPKANIGVSGTFPSQTFFEGGINIPRVIPDSPHCFASFLAETRSSSSETAQLKDFVLGSFPVCQVELSKTCETGTLGLDNMVHVPFTVTVTNKGYGAVEQVVLTDDYCGLGELEFANISLGVGETKILPGECVFNQDDPISVNPVQNKVSAVANGGDIPVVLKDCSSTDGIWCIASCPVDFDPAIHVEKTCTTKVEVLDGKVVAHVYFTGVVTNTSGTEEGKPNTADLVDVVVTDVPDVGSIQLYWDGLYTDAYNPLTEMLEPGDSLYFKGDYYPATLPVDGNCSGLQFTDTVTAGATEPYLGTTVKSVDSASCALCPANCTP